MFDQVLMSYALFENAKSRNTQSENTPHQNTPPQNTPPQNTPHQNTPSEHAQPALTLYARFARSAAAHPHQPALIADGTRLTYHELAASVDAAAARIVESCGGAVPAAVALYATRTPAAYTGYLAAQRLGATVVPLNPVFPPQRNASIVRSSGAAVVVADHREQPTGLPVPILPLDPAAPTGSAPAGTLPLPLPLPLPEPSTDPDAIAYILFTSGSTGAPKGVPIAHRNVSAYLDHVIPRYGLGPGARLSQTFDLTFDPSVFDMFAAWGSGAALVVPSRDDLMAPVRFVNRHAVTHWSSVPSIISFAARLRGLPPGSMPTLRWSLFAGEALTLRQARAWHAAAPDSVIENLYGPTELTVTCSEYRLPESAQDWPSTANGTVPLGEVYPELGYAIVGEDGLPAEDGELCVRGPQRFGGYWDPAQNAGRFLADADGRFLPYEGDQPLGPEHWYRTGDRVRRENGLLVHYGRLDHQLKIRGYRVELGEIESALRDQDGVLDAVVLALVAADGEADLLGVYTGVRRDEEQLLAALRSRLPGYMVPRRLHWRDDLPLNANGKVDRRLLSESLKPVAA